LPFFWPELVRSGEGLPWNASKSGKKGAFVTVSSTKKLMLKNELESLPQAETRSALCDLTYLRPAQVPRRYPFSRSILYELLGAGKIKSISVRKPGSVRGIRLVSVASIEAFLAKLVAEQKDEKLLPVVTREPTEKKIAKGPKVVKRAPRRAAA
jgi:hypothetical protein